MPIILSIETSTPVCSVALHKDGGLVGLSEFFEGKSHSRVLNEQIIFLCKNAGIEIQELDAIAISKGPGSYTGLRIGVATAKGFCYGIDKPLISVSTLEAMAYKVNKFNPLSYHLCPMLDARRMEVYCCLYNSSLLLTQPVQAKILDQDTFRDELNTSKIFFFGSGSEKAMNLLSVHRNALFVSDVYPSASEIGSIAHKKLLCGSIENTAYFEPYYLKEFIITSNNEHGN